MLSSGVRRKLEGSLFRSYPKSYDEHNFIFIHIPKTGGQSVGRILGNKRSIHLSYKEYETLLGQEKLKAYRIFTVVRHPQDRLVSAWRYLKEGGNKSLEDKQLKDALLSPCEDINDFIAKLERDSSILNTHFFKKQSHFLENSQKIIPKEIEILHLENLEGEIKKISGIISAPDKIPHLNSSKGPSVTLNRKSVETIKKLYYEDFSNFGYL